MEESIYEILYHWSHPCGDDYYLYPEDQVEQNKICEEYILRIQTDKLLQS